MRMSLPRAARVVSVRDESPTVRSLILDACLDAGPGQFVMAWLPGVNEKPFSLVRADPVTLAVANVGPFSAAVHALLPGDRLWLRGPLGRGFALPAAGRPGALLLVAGGYGAAPLCFVADRAAAAGRTVIAVIGARTAQDVILAGEMRAAGAEVYPATEDGSLGARGLATEVVDGLLAGRGPAYYQGLYACGPEPMLAAVECLAARYRLPAQLSYERVMRCAFGVCGTCACEGWLVCADGPVKRVDPA